MMKQLNVRQIGWHEDVSDAHVPTYRMLRLGFILPKVRYVLHVCCTTIWYQLIGTLFVELKLLILLYKCAAAAAAETLDT